VYQTQRAFDAWIESARQAAAPELTQRIGNLCRQVNERDKLIAEVANLSIEYTSVGRYHCVQMPVELWNDLQERKMT
jgi:hypothetical protein